MFKLDHVGNTKFYTIIPILLYISVTEIKQEDKMVGKKAVAIAIHITPLFAFGFSIIKKFNEYENW
jgi:uncharacterized membrane protein YadS